MKRLIVKFRDEVEPRVYTLKAQIRHKVYRHSANAYWETAEQFEDRGPAPVETTAHFILVEEKPYQGNCEFFEAEEDVYTFFRLLRTESIEVTA